MGPSMKERPHKSRSYDKSWYRGVRRQLKPLVEAGLTECVRCGKPIEPGEPWDLGHDDVDKAVIRGPEHQRCNRSTRTHRLRRTSRFW